MDRSRPARGRGVEPSDEYRTDSDGSRLSIVTILTVLLPSVIARRAIAVSVTTDRDVYERDESVEITVEFKNRLPIPVELPTPRQRRWGWTVNGYLEASDARLYTRKQPATFDFRGGERKQLSVTWNGRIERVQGTDRHESVVPEPGTHEIRAFAATREDDGRPSDSTTITIR
ncbi:hypothetical protein [Natrinema sp. J7-1]|uniref:hypothetical protein n=1 Tax=Natrinema sp. J7-1 TaxID=1172566 RepID=UPI000677A4ED|nr:hypothetical protein [Natrinema sp. J7-1]